MEIAGKIIDYFGREAVEQGGAPVVTQVFVFGTGWRDLTEPVPATIANIRAIPAIPGEPTTYAAVAAVGVEFDGRTADFQVAEILGGGNVEPPRPGLTTQDENDACLNCGWHYGKHDDDCKWAV